MAEPSEFNLLRTVVLCILLVAVGTSLAYGVPAWLHRRHAAEAIDMLGKLSRAASVYYVKPRGDAVGDRMLCQFPRGDIRTTLALSCCDPTVSFEGGNKCDPAKIVWNRTLWKTLRFELADHHPFVYEYKATGVLGDARFEVSAYGDLDCDGVYSTFRFAGKGDPDSKHDDCVLRTTPEFTAINEGE